MAKAAYRKTTLATVQNRLQSLVQQVALMQKLVQFIVQNFVQMTMQNRVQKSVQNGLQKLVQSSKQIVVQKKNGTDANGCANLALMSAPQPGLSRTARVPRTEIVSK